MPIDKHLRSFTFNIWPYGGCWNCIVFRRLTAIQFEHKGENTSQYHTTSLQLWLTVSGGLHQPISSDVFYCLIIYQYWSD